MKMASASWGGVFPAAVTLFQPDHAIDYPATLKHVDRLIAAGAQGLIVLGSVGENCSLEADEKRELLRAAVARVAGKVPVLAGVAEYTTSLACRFACDAKRLGADGLMVLPAMAYRADPREALAHLRAVARAAPLPVMCYNNPPSYGVDLVPPLFAELADEENVVAIKESSGDVRRITDLVNLFGDRFLLFCGVDDLVLESYALGAVGWVSGLVNAFPDENRRLWDLLTDGNLEGARALYRWYTPLLHLDTYPKLVQYIKLAMAECGLGAETVRPPRLSLVSEERERILQIIRKAIETRPSLGTPR
jgi:1-pyrroline-4-hydroxy-2-carboxylate deaminase